MTCKHNRRRRKSPTSLVDSAFLDELLGRRDPSAHRTKPDYKAHMICRQAHEALSLALGESADEALLDTLVESVEPAPDASRLAVRIALSPSSEATWPQVMEALDRQKGRLRGAVAASITRKRAPELIFVPAMSLWEGDAS